MNTDRGGGSAARRWAIAVLVILLVWFLASITPSWYAIERPGPVIDALGTFIVDEEERPVLEIRGADTFPDSGELNILSVAIVGSPDRPASWIDVGGALFDPSRSVVPLAELYPENVTTEQRAEVSAAMMRSSQQQAIAAALGTIDMPYTSRLSITGVVEGGPSDGVLEAGDILRTVEGEPVTTFAELRAVLRAAPPEAALHMGVTRANSTAHVEITPERVSPEEAPLLGVTVATEYEFPIDVEVNLGRVGGPSAGMMLALSVYDLLTPGALTGGVRVSGTGTVDSTGAVGAIGGLEQKLWAAARDNAELLLLPLDNCADLPEQTPGNLMVAPVATLDEAIAAIETVAAGGVPPGAERCVTGEFVSGDG